VLYCWRTSDGQQMWTQRLKGPISASPVLAGKHIYWPNEAGTMYVVAPSADKFELVAENQVGEEGFASPAISRGQLFLRTATRSAGKRQEWLYCLGE
jgi:outer membrane protein assembly factor BamB